MSVEMVRRVANVVLASIAHEYKTKEKEYALPNEKRPDDFVSGEGNSGNYKVYGEPV